MKQKIKKILKNNIVCFVLGLIVAGLIGVGATTYFASGDVSYDNTESGLKATNVQNAIDELYNECFPPGPLDGTNFEDKVVTSGDGLYKDEYEEGRYIYKGANPNNYITFSGETWRIISVENDGTIKIINNNATTKEWDTSDLNNWTRPATLNTYLNNTYFQTLSQKDKVVPHDWSIGSVTSGNNDLDKQIENENETIWNGKVGLITLSEFLRANSNINQCESYTLNNNNYSICKETNYLFYIVTPNRYLWTISAFSGNSNLVFFINYNGTVNYSNAHYSSYYFTPVVYLSSDITLTGEGTESNPYIVE